jgi:hypothetical protein
MTVQTLHTDRAFSTACDGALPRLTASWQARTLAAQAAGSDALAIVETLPGQGFPNDFATYTVPLADPAVTPAVVAAARSEEPPLHGILADLLHSGLGTDPEHHAGERGAALRTLQDFQQFTEADADLRRQAAALGSGAAPASDPAMVSTAVGPGGAQLGGAGAALDADLASLTDLHRQRLADAESSARSDPGLGPALALLCAAIAVLCLGGLWTRIDEYRAAR